MNKFNVPFYTRSTGHGSTITLGKFNGVQISTKQLNQIKIQPGGKTAILGGGTYGKQIIEYFWDRGYVTGKHCCFQITYDYLLTCFPGTGSCGCVSLLGPGLGGGHGRMQGKNGLISDHFVSLNVVLANGSTIVVNDKSHKDLFWGMKGAGHNFGIVTSLEHKIYPRVSDLWYSKIYTFNGTKLEQFHKLANDLAKKQTPELINWAIYMVDPSVSLTEPVIHWAFELIGGTAQSAKKYLKPFDDLGPINSVENLVPYPQIPVLEGTHAEGPLCEKGDQRMQMNAGLKEYNATAQREIFELYRKNIFKHPEWLGSVIVLEGYSVQGVQKVDPASSAYALRDDNLLV